MIVPMKRLTLIALQTDQDAIISALQELSAVEIITPPRSADDTAFDAAFSDLEEKRRAYREAEALVRPYAKKAGLLDPAPVTTPDKLSSCAVQKEAQELLSKINAISLKISETDTLISSVNNTVSALTPWSLFPYNIDSIRPTAHTKTLLGLISPSKYALLEELPCSVTIIEENKLLSVMIVCHKADFDTVSTAAREAGLVEFNFPAGMTGNVKDNIRAYTRKLFALREQRDNAKEELSKLGASRDKLLFASDAVSVEIDKEKASAELLVSKAAFMLEGWVCKDRALEVENAVAKVSDAYYLEFFEPIEGEVVPSVVKNNKFVRPFEAITNLYSRPDPRGLDPTPFMAPFYLLFFGMMLSDSGYGLVLYLLVTLYLRIKKPKGAFADILQVCAWGGLSTIICGFLVGTFFGLDFDVVFGTPDIFPLIFDPMYDSMNMILLCCGLGVVQILFGVGIKAYMCVKRGDTAGAIFDCVSWILLLIGIIGAFAFKACAEPFYMLAILGAAMILLFAGRAKKNIFGRITSGFGALYGITSYLSDAVSYSRIFAMGLVTGAMGMVFNMLGDVLYASDGMILTKLLTFILAAIVLVVLHGFSLFINALGSFSHTARLQFVEFYGKFYEAGGKEFKPLGYNTKYVNVKRVSD